MSESSPKSMKEENEPKLYAFTAFQFSVFSIIFLFPHLEDQFKSEAITTLFGAVALGGVAVASTIFTDVLPTSWKSKLTHIFMEEAKHHATSTLKGRHSGADLGTIKKIYSDQNNNGVKSHEVFNNLREFTESYPSVYQSYKKYLLVRELACLQLFISLSAIVVSALVNGWHNIVWPYVFYMAIAFIMLCVATITTDYRVVEIVHKRAVFHSKAIEDALEKRAVAPLSLGKKE